jgi:hypothetical protein
MQKNYSEMTINELKKHIGTLVEKADKILFKPDGESSLLEILEIQKFLDEKVDEAKKIIETSALKINQDFSSVFGDKVKVFYRKFGQKYYIEQDKIQQIPTEMLNEKISYTLKTDLVEKFASEKGALPVGVRENERLKAISFRLIADKNGGDNE